MAANDVTPSEVFGIDAGIYAGDSIPSAITTSTDLFIIIPVSQAVDKANLAGITFFNTPITESQFDSSTDVFMLIQACAYSYSELHAKGAPTYSLRKFTCSYFGWGSDNNQFEAGKAFDTKPFQLTCYQENGGLSDTYNPSINTLV